MLQQTIAGLRRMSIPVDIVVHDNGSSDEATLQSLDQLERDGTRVIRRPPIACADDLNLVEQTVADYFSGRRRTDYVVSDCDIDLSIADPAALEVYGELLARFPKLECVGPMLRITDVPRTYPLYNHLMNRHIEQFWGKRPSWVECSTGRIGVQLARIDTSLALHRAETPFRRKKAGLRVYAPFEARHLDWYVDANPGDAYAATSNAAISHWRNAAAFERLAAVTLRYSRFFIVAQGREGAEEQVVNLAASGSAAAAP